MKKVLKIFTLKNHSKSKGFTLAEAISVIVLLGVVATLVIPTTMRRAVERENKAKLRKALASYQTLIEKIIVEEGIARNEDALNNWANNDGNCTNARRYLQGQQDGANPCIFRSTDGLWYNITNLSKTFVGFDDHGRPTNVNNDNIALGDEYKAFMLVTSFDNNGSARVHDQQYEETANTKDGGFMREGAKSWATRKTECFFNSSRDCSRDRSICVGNGNSQRCLSNFQPIGNGCLRSGGAVLRVDRRWVNISVCGDRVQQTFTDGNGNITGELTCNQGACFVNNGGYMCETVGNRIQCHINGGEVSDIEYDMNGNVTNVVCNRWNPSCVEAAKNNSTIPSPMTCKTACCSYNSSTNSWETCGKEEDKYLFTKASCMLMQQNAQQVPESCKEVMADIAE